MLHQELVEVAHASDTAACRRLAAAAGDRVGLGSEDFGRLALVVTELATNLLKHAPRGGTMVIGGRDGAVELLAMDSGPGMANISRCIEDGYSTAGSPGTGLGAVRRLSNRFDLYSRAGSGTIAFATIASASTLGHQPPAAFLSGGLSVSMRGETVNGDDWACQYRPHGLTLMVVDGLGHGALAHEAAEAAVGAFTSRMHRSVAAALEIVHAALRPTRGAAAAIASVDTTVGLLEYAGIGNVCGAILNESRPRQLVSMNGTLGHGEARVKAFTYPWHAASTLVMHSDGVSSRWDIAAYPGLLAQPPSVIAAALYRDHSRQRDDATVVVARELAP